MSSIFLNNPRASILFVALILIVSSCGTTKNVPYFKNIVDSGTVNIPGAPTFHEPTIQPDDILSISLFTIDPTTSMIVNQLATQSAIGILNTPASTNPSATGFLVDKNGEIQLSVIGKVNLLGLTTFQARDLIQNLALKSFNSPNVQVRYLNFKITVLGEVSRPSTYSLANEKVTVLDALGLAGDMTIYGKRENVLLIRDNNGQRELTRLNLNSDMLFKSPYFYLKQNDVIYVEPNKGKAASLNIARTQTIAIIGTALSVLIALIARL